MNFLAHLLLSGDKSAVIMGNYVGDFVKGRLTDEKTVNWNQEYVAGLKLHRHIDMFTDSHPVVREAKNKVAEVHGRIAGIIVDIYFDYFLAKYFNHFCSESLLAYSDRMYTVIQKNEYLIPEAMIPMSRSMIRQDWLNSYATFEGIDLTFNRMSRRADFLVSIKDAGLELRKNEEFYFQKFRTFFPELQEISAAFITENVKRLN
ncbi:ACP phosphodiesterase [Dyadobacter sp. NIV53]|uniref:acyl carrier protein phosphodiesterase n=1 Tax=Dyadobacter sp. NIV53 TaxID=2861765 RepID=UPI001C87B467|nr:ACP phosphodiesterase [Dyadobacter sp. NIV53]